MQNAIRAQKKTRLDCKFALKEQPITKKLFFFYFRMYSKMDQIDRSIRQSGRRSGGGSNAALTTLAKESFDILTLLPTYIESTKTAVSELKEDSKVCKFQLMK